MAGSVNHRALRWLRGQLPELIAGGVITTANAEAIDRHYQAAESRAPNFGYVVLAAIGAALVGAGAILLVAHNWDDLSRTSRCVIAFLPLIVAHLLGFFVLLKRNDSSAWRESVALLDVTAVAAAIALISQTYQLQGSFADFMRVWLLLSIPIVYLFRANFSALFYIIGCAVWMLSKAGWSFNRPGEVFFWGLLLLIVPFYVAILRQRHSGWAFRVLSLALMAASAIGLAVTIDFAKGNLGGLAFAGFFATVYLAGMRWQDDGNRSLNVLSVVGGMGVAATAVTLSFESLWDFRSEFLWSGLSLEQQIALGIVLLFPVVALTLAVWSMVQGRIFYSLSAACIPLVAALARIICGVAPGDHSYALAAAALFNFYALILGIELLARGIRAGSLARANFGLLVIAALALARFFDSDLSFVARGVGFIAVGAGFLVANMIFFRRRARA